MHLHDKLPLPLPHLTNDGNPGRYLIFSSRLSYVSRSRTTTGKRKGPVAVRGHSHPFRFQEVAASSVGRTGPKWRYHGTAENLIVAANSVGDEELGPKWCRNSCSPSRDPIFIGSVISSPFPTQRAI